MRPSGSERPPGGVYVHTPFCSVRCTYCDFPTVAGRDDRTGAYLDALVREIETAPCPALADVDTVFFGGGTPSRLTRHQVQRVLAAIRGRFALDPAAEVTLEGNPESLTAASLAGFREAGITRVSVGVQSLDDAVLRRVGRAHDAAGARRAVREARGAGFAEVSLDLIAGLPGEDLARWDETIAETASWEPDHVSVYLLESDKDTPLGRAVRGGRLRVGDDDELAAAYEATVAALERAGFALYEISNFAKGGRRSHHNLKYWTDVAYAGFGLGAASYLDGERRSNRRDLDGYVADVAAGRSPMAERDPYEAGRRLEEALFLGLRVVEGIDLELLTARYGLDVRGRFAAAWERARAAGLIAESGPRIALTRAGRLRGNELFADLVDSDRPL
jgi:oxygen-independent coproporphyrinogen-3 oxidase